MFMDYTCPFSFLTTHQLERVAHDLHVSVERCAFELSPAPQPVAPAPSEQQWATIADLAAQAAVVLRRPAFVPRTRKAHEATKFAAKVGMAEVLERAIFEAYFTRAEDIGRIDVLVDIGAAAGIDRFDLKLALDLDVHTDDVVSDRRRAEALEITGTPALLAGNDLHVGYLSEKQLRDWLGD